MAHKTKRTAETEPDYADTPIISVEMDIMETVHTVLGTASDSVGEPSEPRESVSPVATEPSTDAPCETPTLSEEESWKQRVMQLEREVFEMRSTLGNITPLVIRGVPKGEILFYLQNLDQRITVIENYLRMVTSS